MNGWILAFSLGAVTLAALEIWGRWKGNRKSVHPQFSGIVIRLRAEVARILQFIQPEQGNRSVKVRPLQAILYDIYVISFRERLIVILVSGMFTGVIGYVFYKSIVVSIVAGVSGFWFPRVWSKLQVRRRKSKLLVQFRQALYCISSSLTAGKSVENAFRDALSDLKLLYIDPACLIVREFEAIVQRLDNGEPIELAVADFARRAMEEDIINFCDVLVTSKRTGGNLVEVMRRTAAIIGEKLEIEADIAVMLAQKKFESRVLTGAPILIIAVLSFTSAEYMEPLFHGVGRIIMTASMGMLGLCFWFTQKMMRISV
jgi:tight adherence protein B